MRNNGVVQFHGHIPQWVRFHPSYRTGWRKPKRYKALPDDRVVSISEGSRVLEKVLTTVFVGMSFQDILYDTTIDTANSAMPLVDTLNYLRTIPGYTVDDNLENTKQREARERPGLPRTKKGATYRDGRRRAPKPVLLVTHDLNRLLGRLLRTNAKFRKAVRAGQRRELVNIGEYEIEIAQLNVGGASSCSAEFYIRWGEYHEKERDPQTKRFVRKSTRQVMRLIFFDLNGYLKNVPDQELQNFLEVDASPPVPELREYVAYRSMTSRKSYIRLKNLLTDIAPEVIRRNGTLPQSIAGAGIKIALSHMETEYIDAPTQRVSQMGALALYGGRSFFHNPRENIGYHDRLSLYDGKSWHGFIMTQLPAIETVQYRDIPPSQAFNVDDWRGKFGVMCVSGVSLDSQNPPLVKHNIKESRLEYIRGSFTREYATIPAIMLGIVSGRLKVTAIHDGIVLDGTAGHGMLHNFTTELYARKESCAPGSLQSQIIKELINVVPGKLAEVKTNRPYVDPDARNYHVPEHLTPQDIKDLTNAYIDGQDTLYDKSQELLEREDTTGVRFGDHLARHLGYGATTGCYYNPMIASQIWGMSSAMLALAAFTTGAISGYTDSLIVDHDPHEGLAEYRRLVRLAGYLAPEEGIGSFQAKVSNGYGYLARAGTWVIRWNGYTDRETGEVIPGGQEQALHLLDGIEPQNAWEVIRKLANNKSIAYDVPDKPLTLVESYRHRVEPGTTKSEHREIALRTKSEQIEQRVIERSEKLLQQAMGKLARTSTHDVPLPTTPLGCLKILVSYGLSQLEISTLTPGLSQGMVKHILAERKSGATHLAQLQELVTRIEQERLGTTEPESLPELEPEQVEPVLIEEEEPQIEEEEEKPAPLPVEIEVPAIANPCPVCGGPMGNKNYCIKCPPTLPLVTAQKLPLKPRDTIFELAGVDTG